VADWDMRAATVCWCPSAEASCTPLAQPLNCSIPGASGRGLQQLLTFGLSCRNLKQTGRADRWGQQFGEICWGFWWSLQLAGYRKAISKGLCISLPLASCLLMTIESEKHLGWKRPLRPSIPTINNVAAW